MNAIATRNSRCAALPSCRWRGWRGNIATCSSVSSRTPRPTPDLREAGREFGTARRRADEPPALQDEAGQGRTETDDVRRAQRHRRAGHCKRVRCERVSGGRRLDADDRAEVVEAVEEHLHPLLCEI